MVQTGLVGQVRRWLSIGFLGLVALVLLAPMAAQLAGFQGWREGENRTQAPLPATPSDLSSLRAWPRAVDAALNDRFGLRPQLVALHNVLLFRLFGGFSSHLILAGPNGRLFLTDSWIDSPSRLSCGRGLPRDMVPRLARMSETVMRRLQDRAPRIDLLVAPGAPALYPSELPVWLRADCEESLPFARQMLDAMAPDIRRHAFYPLAELAAMTEPGPAIPRYFLHWDGAGAGLATALWAEGQRGLARRMDMQGVWHEQPSDLSGFFPGISLSGRVMQPLTGDLETCLGAACMPDVTEIAQLLVDIRRYRAVHAGAGRVLVLSDSFGQAAAPWLARYFGEVLHITVNHLDLLSQEQRRRLGHSILEEYRPDQVLLVILDASLRLTLPRLLSLLD